jgi:hypothetical protein
MQKAINICSFISLHQSCDGWWKNVKLVSELFMLITYRQQTWLLFLKWFNIIGGRGPNTRFDPDLFLSPTIKIHSQFGHPPFPCERASFNLWTAGNRVLGPKRMYWFMIFFMAKIISELQCAYDQRDYLSVMYSFCASNTWKWSKPHAAYLTNVDNPLAPTMEW